MCFARSSILGNFHVLDLVEVFLLVPDFVGIACTIDDERSMRSRRDTAPDFGEMHGHCIGVGGGQDERRRSAALRTDGPKM